MIQFLDWLESSVQQRDLGRRCRLVVEAPTTTAYTPSPVCQSLECGNRLNLMELVRTEPPT